MDVCRHLARQIGEMMGTAKIAIELAADLGAEQAAAVERMANSSLMLMPSYQEGMRRHLTTIGSKGSRRARQFPRYSRTCARGRSSLPQRPCRQLDASILFAAT